MILPRNFISSNHKVHDKYDPLNIFEDFTSYINDFNRTDENKYVRYVRRWIIKHIKFPLLSNRISKGSRKILKESFKHPETIVYHVMRYSIFLLYFSTLFQVDLEDLLKGIFENNRDSCDIIFEYNDTRENAFQRINKIIIINYNLNSLYRPTNDRFIKTKLRLDLDERIYTIEEIVYKCSTKLETATAGVESLRRFQIDEKGRILNPYYKFGKHLKAEEYSKYSVMAVNIMGILDIILRSVLNVGISKQVNDTRA